MKSARGHRPAGGLPRDFEYRSNWGRKRGDLGIELEGLKELGPSELSKSGYKALASTPRFQNIMQHVDTPIEIAAAENYARPHPPAVHVQGQGGVVTDLTTGESYYEIQPSTTRALKSGRKYIPPIRLPLGHTGHGPIAIDTNAMTHSGRLSMRPTPTRPTMKSAPLSARRAPQSPRSARAAVRRPPPTNAPHRVYPPPFMNAPPRQDFKGAVTSERAARRANKAAIQDYVFRATACKRAGRRRAEANAYYSMGVLLDNNREYIKAIECYQQFQEVLVSTEDKFAQALAHNSIGVSYMNLGGPGSLEQAIKHHSRHRDLADVPGQFIAHTNLGLVYSALGDQNAAAANHQQALRCAIRMQSVAGQSVAIGNLGLAGMANGDFTSARVCLERHLELTRQLGDVEGEAIALQKLGEIANHQGQFGQAAANFSEAWKTANETGDRQQANISKVNLGVARATSLMDERLRQMGQAMMSGGGY